MPDQTTDHLSGAVLRDCEEALDLMGGWSEHHDLGAITEAVAPLLATYYEDKGRKIGEAERDALQKCADDLFDQFMSQQQRAIDAEEERDLAIAHDRQPYPTAEAYEKVCAARTKWQERAEAAEDKGREAERQRAKKLIEGIEAAATDIYYGGEQEKAEHIQHAITEALASLDSDQEGS